MITVHEVARLRQQVQSWRAQGQRIGFVPTMGNLHQGHLCLVRKAQQVCDRVVVSIFVNPLQFGPNEDFATYPRTLSADAEQLSAMACDLLFAPTAQTMYPNGRQDMTRLQVPRLGRILEGEFRPGFFDGVATVVNILFNQVQADVAVFGQKDYQQLLMIRRMVNDLHLPVEIIGHPTAREADGLALSSRNQYLDAASRQQAPQIHALLQQTVDQLRKGRQDYAAIEAEGLAVLKAQGFTPQYLCVRNPDLDNPCPGQTRGVVLVAALLGSTRLIDNVIFEL